MKTKRRILYVQYTSPGAYPPLEHSSQLLADGGWEVLFLGISKQGDPPLRWPDRRGIIVRELSPSRSGWLRKLHYAWFAAWVLGWTLRWRPACIYASDVLACPVVLPLSYWPGVSIVYHEHDGPQLSRLTIVSRLLLWTRRKLAERARARVLPNQARAGAFVRAVGNHRPTFSVWNCPIVAELSRPREPQREPGLQLLYAGSIVPVRLPTSVIEALALLPDGVRLRAIGYVTAGHRDYVQELRTLAARLGVEQQTQFLDGVPHPELLVRSRDADVGLVLMPVADADSHRQWMPGASNKPFDYLASGLALLVSDEPGWRQMYVDPGYGLACRPDDPRSIAGALQWLMDHPEEMRAMGERGRRRVAAEWNYETQFAPVRAWLDRHARSLM